MRLFKAYTGFIIVAIVLGGMISPASAFAAQNSFTTSLAVTGVDLLPPSIPTGLATTSVSSTEIDLAWNASTDDVGVVGYRLFRNGSFLATTTQLSYADQGLTPLTAYSYTVEAFDGVPRLSGQSPALVATTTETSVVPPPATSTPPVVPPTSSSGSGSYVGSTANNILPTSPVNATDFRAVPLQKSIELSWNIPMGVDISGIRLVRSDKFFPRDPTEGEVIAEGNLNSFDDTLVEIGTDYYYALFTKDPKGNYSGGALAYARIPVPGQPAATSSIPFINIPVINGVSPIITALTLKDFNFIQDGTIIPNDGKTISIDGTKNLTVRLDYSKIAESLKTIVLTLTDPADATKVFSFLLRVNDEKTAFESTIGPLGKSGQYGLYVSVLDYKNQGLKQLSGNLQASVLGAETSAFGGESWSMGDAVVWILLALFLVILGFVTYSIVKGKRRGRSAFASILVVCALGTLGIFGIAKANAASFNPEINYQGKLANNLNVTVADGTYNMEFKLYTLPSGGSPLWTETLTGANKVQVTNGLFSVMLGSTSPLTGIDFNQPLYLGVKIESDTEMTPRKILGAVPAAFVAGTSTYAVTSGTSSVAFSANTLSGLASSSFLRSDTQNATSSSSTFLNVLQSGAGKIAEFFGAASQSVLSILSNGNVGIGSSTPSATLAIQGTSTAPNTNLLNIASSSGTTLFTVLPNGNVGLGMASPGYPLHVFKSSSVSAAPVDVAAFEVSPQTARVAGFGPAIIFKDSGASSNFMARIAGVYETSGGSLVGALSFYTNPTGGSTDTMLERMRISNTGNVGIGTTSPSNKLEVAGNGYFTGNLTGTNITATGTLSVLTVSTSTFTGPVRASCFTTDGTACIQSISTTSSTNWNTAYNTVTASSTFWDTAYLNRITSASLPLSFTGNVLSISQASSTANGYLSSTDWNAFNGKTSSQWTTSGSNIYYPAGNVSIGTSSVPNALNVVSTTTSQLRLAYDVNNYLTAAVASNGATTLSLNGTTGGLIINNPQPAAVSSGNGSNATTSLTVVGATGGNTSWSNSGVQGGTGGAISIIGGMGGIPTDTSNGFNMAGAGGDTTVSGGVGGSLNYTPSLPNQSAGGPGGTLSLLGGRGGNNSLGTWGGNGGAVKIYGGLGSDAGPGGVAGAGGTVWIAGGAPGAGFGAVNANVFIGATTTDAAAGNIFFGNFSGSNVASFIGSSGNFGIGTTSPSNKLEVVGNGYFAGNLIASYIIATSTTATSTFSGNVTIGGTNVFATNNSLAVGGTGSGIVSAYGTGSAAFGFAGAYGGLGSILSSGTGALVGGEALGLASAAAVTSSGAGSLAYGLSSAPAGAANITASNSGSIAFGYANSKDILSQNNGSFAAGYANAGNIVSSGEASFAFGDNLTASAALSTAFGSGFTNSTANSFMIGYGATPTLTVTATGLGIGTTTPSNALEVAGNGYFSGNLWASSITATSTTATSTFAGGIDVQGNSIFGIPGAKGDGTTDDTAAINAAIASHNYVQFTAGKNYLITNTIKIPSNRIIDFNGSTITLAASSSAYAIENSDVVNGNDNITILNGTLNGNGETQTRTVTGSQATTYYGFGIYFYQVGHIKVDNWTINDTKQWGIAYLRIDTAIFNNITINQSPSGTNGDGITGGARLIYMSNIRGYSNDDLIGVANGLDGDVNYDIDGVYINNVTSTTSVTNQSMGIGIYPSASKHINNIYISNVSGNFNYDILRIVQYFSTTGTIENINLKNIAGKVNGTKVIIPNFSSFTNTTVSTATAGSLTGIYAPAAWINLMPVVGTDGGMSVLGNVGIGTTTPSNKLEVAGDFYLAGKITATSTATSTFTGTIKASCFTIDGSTCLSNSGGSSQWTLFGSNLYPNLTSYNVGIGTTSPSNKLEVAGNGYFSGNLTGTNITATGTLSVLTVSTSTFTGPVRASCFTTDGTTCLSAGGASLSGGTTGALTYWTSATTVGATTSPVVGYITATSTTATSTFAGDVTIGSSATTTFMIDSTGNVGIGTSTPSKPLSVSGNVLLDGLMSSSANQTYDLCLDSSKNVIADTVAAGCISSSARFKHGINDLNISGLDEVMALRPVSFYYNSNGDVSTSDATSSEQLGFIAEEAAKIDPRLIGYGSDGLARTFKYENYTSVLTKAIQEQQGQIRTLASTTSALASLKLATSTQTQTVNYVAAVGASTDPIDANIQNMSDRLDAAVASTSEMIGSLASSTATTLATSTSFIQGIATAVQNLIQSAGNWMVQSLTAHVVYVDRIEARVAVISNGLEMTDQATGMIYCVQIKNGDFGKTMGQCTMTASSTEMTGSSTPLVNDQQPMINNQANSNNQIPIVNNQSPMINDQIGTSTIVTPITQVTPVTSTSTSTPDSTLIATSTSAIETTSPAPAASTDAAPVTTPTDTAVSTPTPAPVSEPTLTSTTL